MQRDFTSFLFLARVFDQERYFHRLDMLQRCLKGLGQLGLMVKTSPCLSHGLGKSEGALVNVHLPDFIVVFVVSSPPALSSLRMVLPFKGLDPHFYYYSSSPFSWSKAAGDSMRRFSSKNSDQFLARRFRPSPPGFQPRRAIKLKTAWKALLSTIVFDELGKGVGVVV